YPAKTSSPHVRHPRDVSFLTGVINTCDVSFFTGVINTCDVTIITGVINTCDVTFITGIINTCDGGSNTGGTSFGKGLTGGGDLNHAVVIVGDGTTDDGVEFWVLLNSWGLDWGAGGYALVKKLECNICQAIFQPILMQGTKMASTIMLGLKNANVIV
ncbi:PREDICTED: cysteine proteinase-like, partial [Priapulus caudatus]|uniref:Cysteine proteinase-like n=1 Tax=Priapulus caudatus TaxID=37621 RepID=A0ABM1F3K4_PRICU